MARGLFVLFTVLKGFRRCGDILVSGFSSSVGKVIDPRPHRQSSVFVLNDSVLAASKGNYTLSKRTTYR